MKHIAPLAVLLRIHTRRRVGVQKCILPTMHLTYAVKSTNTLHKGSHALRIALLRTILWESLLKAGIRSVTQRDCHSGDVRSDVLRMYSKFYGRALETHIYICIDCSVSNYQPADVVST
jgi:hypothetical protein